MPPVYQCVCCARRAEPGVCPCVFGTCRRCLMCLTHCHCPERFARNCADDTDVEPLDTELDDPAGPFGRLAEVPQAGEPIKPTARRPGD